MIVRRLPVEAVQWHKPGDHPADTRSVSRFTLPGYWPWIMPEGVPFEQEGGKVRMARPGHWLVEGRVLTPEQFEAEYECVG